MTNAEKLRITRLREQGLGYTQIANYAPLLYFLIDACKNDKIQA